MEQLEIVTNEKRMLDNFMTFHHLKTEDKFYIFDKFEKKYISRMTQPRKGIISYRPLLFTIRKFSPPVYERLGLANGEFDIRPLEVIYRICLNILLNTWIDSKCCANNNQTGINDITYTRYTIKKYSELDTEEFRKYSYIQYLDSDSESLDDKEIYKSVCQLYSVYPGKKFYIYNIEEKIFHNMRVDEENVIKIFPVEFTYENYVIKHNKTGDPNIQEYIDSVFRRIYDDFFIHKTGATKYRLVRKDNMKEEDLRGYTVSEFIRKTAIEQDNRLEQKLIDNNITKNGDTYVNFLLRTCYLDKNSLSVISQKDGLNIKFLQFSYNNDEGLMSDDFVSTTLDIDDKINRLNQLEEQIIDGTLIPIDVKLWEEKISKLDEYKLKCI